MPARAMTDLPLDAALCDRRVVRPVGKLVAESGHFESPIVLTHRFEELAAGEGQALPLESRNVIALEHAIDGGGRIPLTSELGRQPGVQVRRLRIERGLCEQRLQNGPGFPPASRPLQRVHFGQSKIVVVRLQLPRDGDSLQGRVDLIQADEQQRQTLLSARMQRIGVDGGTQVLFRQFQLPRAPRGRADLKVQVPVPRPRLQQLEIRTERVLKSLWRERHRTDADWLDRYRALENQSEQVRRPASPILENLLGKPS